MDWVEIITLILAVVVGTGFFAWAMRHSAAHAVMEERLSVEIARRIKGELEVRIARAEELSSFKRSNSSDHERMNRLLGELRDSVRDLFLALDLSAPKPPNGDGAGKPAGDAP